MEKDEDKKVELICYAFATNDFKIFRKPKSQTFIFKKNKMKRLTKQEMYNAITSKYPSLKALDIYGGFKRSGVSRDELFDIMIEFRIHKSRHLTKEQKNRLKFEIMNRSLNNI